MTDRPILFSAPMVRALLEGRKTQTRRIAKFIKSEPTGRWHVANRGGGMIAADDESVVLYGPDYAPYEVGDRLWAREAGDLITYAEDHNPITGNDEWRIHGWKHHADGAIIGFNGHNPAEYIDDCSLTKRPSIHMPRWASRLTLIVTDVRVQRLQDISPDDAAEEGAKCDMSPRTFVDHYRIIWERINGTGSWDKNPWVLALTFTVHHCNIDKMPAQQEIAA